MKSLKGNIPVQPKTLILIIQPVMSITTWYRKRKQQCTLSGDNMSEIMWRHVRDVIYKQQQFSVSPFLILATCIAPQHCRTHGLSETIQNMRALLTLILMLQPVISNTWWSRKRQQQCKLSGDNMIERMSRHVWHVICKNNNHSVCYQMLWIATCMATQYCRMHGLFEAMQNMSAADLNIQKQWAFRVSPDFNTCSMYDSAIS